jgi:uncharacterized protein
MRMLSFSIFALLILGAVEVPSQAASFDCTKARLADERAVCASRELSEMDVEMAVRFETLTGLVAMGTRGDMGDEQRAFLAARRRCKADTNCLTRAYRARIAVLKSEYDRLKSRGPF